MWRHSRRLARPLLAVVSVLFVLACSKEPPREPIILACTTSAQDSGFLAEILPLFQADQPAYSVKPVVVGTGEALRLGQNGDADVLLVHARQAEEAFVAAGHGVERRDLMYNDFVLLGPASDPAGVRGAPEIAPALAVLASADVGFVSRGDDSGTHKKELALWAEAGVEPAWSGYLSAGQGMGAVVKIASEKQAYTLADRATYLALQGATELDVLVQGDPLLRNQYGIIRATRAANPTGAQVLIDWLTGLVGQAHIGRCGVERYGQALFTPNAG